MKYKLYPHQEEAVQYALKHKYFICALSMGLGKTLVAIDTVIRTGKKAVVVCPAFLRITWANEITKFTDLKPVIFTNKTKFLDFDIAIISYSSLSKFENLFSEVSFVICDEVHMAKNGEAKRTKLLHEYLWEYQPEYFMGLTGTPIKNRIPEWYSLLALCSYCPKPINGKNILRKFRNYYQFCNHFSNRKEFKIHGRKVVKYEGHKNVEELRSYLDDKYLRRKASEVLDLPPIVRKDIVLNETEVDYDLLAAYQDRGKKAFITHKVENAKLKVKHTIKYAKDLTEAGEGPVVIFSEHVEPIEEIALGLDSMPISGKTPMEVRGKMVEAFQAGKLPYLCATIGSLSVGVTLTRATNLIFNDLSYVPGDILQAEKRIHRIGTNGVCTVHRMFWGKIDVQIAKELDKKLKTLVEVL